MNLIPIYLRIAIVWRDNCFLQSCNAIFWVCNWLKKNTRQLLGTHIPDSRFYFPKQCIFLSRFIYTLISIEMSMLTQFRKSSLRCSTRLSSTNKVNKLNHWCKIIYDIIWCVYIYVHCKVMYMLYKVCMHVPYKVCIYLYMSLKVYKLLIGTRKFVSIFYGIFK